MKQVDRHLLLEIAAREGLSPDQLAALEREKTADPVARLALWALREKTLEKARRIEREMIGSDGRPGRPRKVDAAELARQVDEVRKAHTDMSLKQAVNIVAPRYPDASPKTLEKARRDGVATLLAADPKYQPITTKREEAAKLREAEKKHIG